MGEGEALQPKDPKDYVGNLSDFVAGVDDDNPLNVELSIDDKTNKIVVFYNKPLTTRINHFEYQMDSSELFFVFQGGEKRNIGSPLSPSFVRHMQNTHQILSIEMNDETGQANRGEFIPVLLQQN